MLAETTLRPPMTNVQEILISLCHSHFYDVRTAVFDNIVSTTILQPWQKPIHSYGQSMSGDVNSIMRTVDMAWVQPENYCMATVQPEVIK